MILYLESGPQGDHFYRGCSTMGEGARCVDRTEGTMVRMYIIISCYVVVVVVSLLAGTDVFARCVDRYPIKDRGNHGEEVNITSLALLSRCICGVCIVWYWCVCTWCGED